MVTRPGWSPGLVTAVPCHGPAAIQPLLDFSPTPFRPASRLLHLSAAMKYEIISNLLCLRAQRLHTFRCVSGSFQYF